MPSTFLQKTAHLLGALAIALTSVMATSHALAQAAPPGRVARLSLMEGAVSFAPAGSDDWSPAEFNRPLTSGDRLQTAPGARAELHSGFTALRINGQTALEISELDDNSTRLTLTQGSLALRVRNLYPSETLEVNTPNLAFTASQPGEYRLDVDPRANTTGVTVRSGVGVVYGENGASRSLGSQQQARFFDRQLGQEEIRANLQRDNFDLWTFARDRAEDQSQSARYVSRDVIGYQQLDGHGDWRTDSEYGAVWFPRVTVGQWAPYQNGQWRWVAPWGWTWVDNAPWGFAPFHYGRWAQIGAQWAWVPGPMNQRPSYAPALVQFDGSNRFDQDRRRPPQGNWIPLAPGQPWRPNDNFNRPQQPDWNRAPRPFDNRPFGNGPTRVEPMVQPPPQPVWPQQPIPHPRPEIRMQDAPRNQAELEQRAQMQRQQQMDRERQQQEQNRNQMQLQQQQQAQRDAAQQQMQQQQQIDRERQQQGQNRNQVQQNSLREQVQRQREAQQQQQQQQQDRQRMEQARPVQPPQAVEPQRGVNDQRRRLLMPGQRPGDDERR